MFNIGIDNIGLDEFQEKTPTFEDRCLRIMQLINLGKGPELIMATAYATDNSPVAQTYFPRCTLHDFDDFSSVYPFDGLWVKYMLYNFELSDFEEYLRRFNDSYPIANAKFRELMHQLDEAVSMVCPRTGEFFGYKKAYYLDYQKKETRDCIVKLQIPNDAKRSSSFGRKCRCSKAKVISIRAMDGEDAFLETARSNYDSNFKYKLGEWVVPDSFDDNRWKECSNGIHFFMTEKEAIDY